VYVFRSGRGRGVALALGVWLGGAAAGFAQQPPVVVKDAAQPVCCAVHGAAGKAGLSPEVKKRFADDAEKLLGTAPAGKAEWGILVVDAQSGETLYQRDAENYFVPASNMKLFTTALALARLGPDYRFRTTLETRGALSRKGRLAGDLVLVGQGDPNLSSRKFPFVKEAEFDGAPEKALAELANQAVARGLREIRGDVVADDSYFPRERYPNGWEVDDLVWSYGAAVSAIVVNDNTVTLTLVPGAAPGKPAAITLEPWTRDFTLRNEVLTSPPGTKPDLTLTRDPGAPLVILRGTYPLKGEPRKMLLAVEEPAEHAAALLKRLLEERGVRVRGTARAQHEPPVSNGPVGPGREPLVLAEHLSVPLADAVQAVNKMSENLHTELLLRAAARQKGPWSTAEDLAKFAAEFYAEAGIAAGDVIQTDGSGLSRHDLVTPRAVVTLLQYAARQPWFPAYYASLPVAGADGTLLDRLKNTPAAGRIHAKTGSVEHVRSLSGFAELPGGRQVIFAILSNNQGAKNHEATAALDALCVALVEDLGQAPAAP
jgi:D-alanyl-D-alanine carboxypeptidase/D-alanyl-D-alanine-endopeptidase (penicillin-binding protein 4)